MLVISVIVHLGAVCCIAIIALPGIISVIIYGVIFSHLLLSLRRDVWHLNASSVCHIHYDPLQGWQLKEREGCYHSVELLHHTQVLGSIVLLHFIGLPKQRYYLLLWFDQMSGDDWRQLVVLLNAL